MSEAAVADTDTEVTIPDAQTEPSDTTSQAAPAPEADLSSSAGGDITPPEGTLPAQDADTSPQPSGDVAPPVTPAVPVERTHEEIVAAYRADANSVTAAELNRAIREEQRRETVRNTLQNLPQQLDNLAAEFANSDLDDPNIQRQMAIRRMQVMNQANANLEPFYDSRLTGKAVKASVDMLGAEAQSWVGAASDIQDAMARTVGWLQDQHEAEVKALKDQVASLTTANAALTAEGTPGEKGSALVGGTGRGGTSYGSKREARNLHAEGKLSNAQMARINADRNIPEGY